MWMLDIIYGSKWKVYYRTIYPLECGGITMATKIHYAKSLMHHHTGNSIVGGGCYLKGHAHGSSCYGTCRQTTLRWTHDANNNFERSYFICDTCGWNGHNNGGITHSPWYKPHQSLVPTCGLKAEYILSCGYIARQIETGKVLIK